MCVCVCWCWWGCVCVGGGGGVCWTNGWLLKYHHTFLWAWQSQLRKHTMQCLYFPHWYNAFPTPPPWLTPTPTLNLGLTWTLKPGPVCLGAGPHSVKDTCSRCETPVSSSSRCLTGHCVRTVSDSRVVVCEGQLWDSWVQPDKSKLFQSHSGLIVCVCKTNGLHQFSDF